jgi:hypothetical protein
MNTNIIKKRLIEIEDKKIEILLKIPIINDDIEKMAQLTSEYSQLGDEYYILKIELIKAKQKV